MNTITLACVLLFASQPVDRTWTDVEVVGHRTVTRAEILKHVPLEIGAPFARDREQWEAWALALEKAFGFHDVGIGAVRFADGRAYLVVDVVEQGDEKRLQFRAPPTGSVPLPEGLAPLHDELTTRARDLFRQGNPSPEHAEAGFLDYDDEQLHDIAIRLVEASRGRREQLVRVVAEDADAAKRATAARLLNWAGDVEQSILDVYTLVDDPDVVVRNNITRFMLHYVGRLESAGTRHAVIDAMADQLRRPSHADRNKALYALRQIVRSHPDDAAYIASRADPGIAAIAEASILENVGGVARALRARIAMEQMFAGHRRKAFPDVPDLSAETVRERLDRVVLLDCRTDAERAVSIIPGAISKKAFASDRDRYRDRVIITYCTIGYRSGVHARELRADGVNAINMRGGVIGWAHADGTFEDPGGKETRRVHVFGDKWDLLPDDYESVTDSP